VVFLFRPVVYLVEDVTFSRIYTFFIGKKYFIFLLVLFFGTISEVIVTVIKLRESIEFSEFFNNLVDVKVLHVPLLVEGFSVKSL
jgi:hypothetical protein